ncbi:MAG: hypothetical protein J0L58_10590 [Burkholderiales bacterium]|nr:hypothetical protein [Burkholderiales bacterium]
MLIIQSETDVESIFSPYVALLRQCVHEAWNDWSESGLAAQMQTKSFRAQYLNNQIIFRAKQATDGRSDVRVDKIRGNHGFVFKNRVFVRPKYAREGYRSSNYPTRSAVAFHDQSVDLFEGIARLELVFTLNKLGTAVQNICLTQRHQRQIQWIYPLVEPAAQSQGNLVPLNREEREASPADRIIKSKKSHGNDQSDQHKRGGGSV